MINLRAASYSLVGGLGKTMGVVEGGYPICTIGRLNKQPSPLPESSLEDRQMPAFHFGANCVPSSFGMVDLRNQLRLNSQPNIHYHLSKKKRMRTENWSSYHSQAYPQGYAMVFTMVTILEGKWLYFSRHSPAATLHRRICIESGKQRRRHLLCHHYWHPQPPN